jgi:D-sedoheptulose 7-phosphate isomerase
MGAPSHDWQAVSGRYLEQFKALLDNTDLRQVERIVDRLREVRDRGGNVFVAGNGGSAATATHLVNDLGKATKRSGRRPMRVMCLSDNVSWLTALANDEGYARAFSGQMENFAFEGDLLLVISASGNSENLIDAVQLAAHRGVHTAALLGFDGGRLMDMVEDYVLIATEIGAYGPVESAHSVVCDLLTTCLIADVDLDRLATPA